MLWLSCSSPSGCTLAIRASGPPVLLTQLLGLLQDRPGPPPLPQVCWVCAEPLCGMRSAALCSFVLKQLMPASARPGQVLQEPPGGRAGLSWVAPNRVDDGLCAGSGNMQDVLTATGAFQHSQVGLFGRVMGHTSHAHVLAIAAIGEAFGPCRSRPSILLFCL